MSALPQKTGLGVWSRGRSWLAAGILLITALAAYHNSFRVPLLLDDDLAITHNATIRHLWPVSEVLSPPPNSGPSGRPLFNLSLAINYAISGTETWSYHAFNLLIHALNGLVLFGIVRRILARRKTLANSASLLAFATALLWTLHPLQTEAVTYLSERAETLMGLFYLLTVYGFVRFAEGRSAFAPSNGAAADKKAGRGRWGILSVVACFFGMATKEVMITAPAIVFLCDSLFFAGSAAKAWRSRPAYYGGLAGSWLLLGGLMLLMGKHSVGFHQGVSAWEYALTECQAVVHYLELAVWPSPLVFDYGPLLVSSPGKVLPDIFLLAVALVGTVVLCRRSPALGFLGICFFVILAPTSSVVPVALQPIAENRMYLPLAALVVGFVLATDRVLGTRAPWLIGAIALASIAWTARNEDYRDAVTLWSDTVRKRPHNPRAQDDFGNALAQVGRKDEAIQHLRLALQLTPVVGRIHYNLAKVLHDTGQRDEAIREYEEAVRLDPTYADAQVNLAAALAEAGRSEEAQARLNSALRLNSGDAASHYNLGLILVRGGHLSDSVREFQRALQLDSTAIEARDALGTALFRLGRADEAISAYEEVLREKPDRAATHHNLGNVLFALGRADEARTHYERALQLQPDDGQAQTSLGVLSLQQGEVEKARGSSEGGLRLDPSDAEAHFRLGNILAMGGRLPRPSRSGRRHCVSGRRMPKRTTTSPPRSPKWEGFRKRSSTTRKQSGSNPTTTAPGPISPTSKRGRVPPPTSEVALRLAHATSRKVGP